MTSKLLFIILIILTWESYAQQIAFNKDRLIFAYSFYEPISNNAYLNTLVVYNTGNDTLFIDSLFTSQYIGYGLDIFLSDTTINTYLYNYVDPWEQIKFQISPKDSASLVLRDPDLCPICKKTETNELIIDSILIHSNSIQNSYAYFEAEFYGSVGITDKNKLPNTIELFQNYPNPFNPTTKIKYSIPKTSFVTLNVYDILGKKVKTLVNEEKLPGSYEVTFNGSGLASGMYFYRLRSESFSQTKKLVLMK